MSAPVRPKRRSSLFRRIYQTFVVTVMIAAAAVGTGAWLLARAMGTEWISEAMERIGEEHDALIDVLDRPAELEQRLGVLGVELDTQVAIYDIDGLRMAGDGPPEIPKRAHRRDRELMHGRPVVHRPRSIDRALVLFPLVDPDDGELLAVVHVVRAPVPRLRFAIPMLLALLGALGLGAWQLSRSITGRLGALEHSVGRIAKGELDHRVAVPPAAVDELDELGDAVNEMACRLERLIAGQRTLLANVSHELRTPISRIKVLLEILQERVELVAPPSDPTRVAALQRLRGGLGEMAQDVVEVETLIGDLLTSGRLELRAGEGIGLEAKELDLVALLGRVVPRFAAELDAAGATSVRLHGDELLLERLFSNLLANARRACPDGRIVVHVRATGERVRIAVEDEGTGIPPEHREAVFEPFRRLDDARSRDRGGVGLGLYLCRQICRAHDGTIVAAARDDGRAGASLQVELPLASAAAPRAAQQQSADRAAPA